MLAAGGGHTIGPAISAQAVVGVGHIDPSGLVRPAFCPRVFRKPGARETRHKRTHFSERSPARWLACCAHRSPPPVLDAPKVLRAQD